MIDGSRAQPFTEVVARIIQTIPRGRVASYGQVARLAGDPRGARQVVRVLNTLSDRLKLPWHRVVNREGRIMLPRGHGFELQRSLLREEDVRVSRDGVVDLARFGWRPADIGRPKQRETVEHLDDLQAKADELKRLQAETQKELDALMPSILARAFRGEL